MTNHTPTQQAAPLSDDLVRRVMHKVFDQRQLVTTFYSFPKDYTGRSRDVARIQLMKSDDDLRATLYGALAEVAESSNPLPVKSVNGERPPFKMTREEFCAFADTKNEQNATLTARVAELEAALEKCVNQFDGIGGLLDIYPRPSNDAHGRYLLDAKDIAKASAGYARAALAKGA